MEGTGPSHPVASPHISPECPRVTSVEFYGSSEQFDHLQDLKFSKLFWSSSNILWQRELAFGHEMEAEVEITLAQPAADRPLLS